MIILNIIYKFIIVKKNIISLCDFHLLFCVLHNGKFIHPGVQILLIRYIKAVKVPYNDISVCTSVCPSCVTCPRRIFSPFYPI